jgi:hypothetical protein
MSAEDRMEQVMAALGIALLIGGAGLLILIGYVLHAVIAP